MARPTKVKAIDLLTQAIGEIPDLKNLTRGSTEFAGWRRDTEVSIAFIFGDEGRHLEEFKAISFSPYRLPFMVVGPGVPDTSPKDRDYRESFGRGLDRAEELLRSMIREIEKTWEDVIKEQSGPNLLTDGLNVRTKVFVVHGRDEGARQIVVRVIEQLGLEAVTLDEKPNQGRTVIEKFEEEATEVGFAVVLLTPDDEGRLKGEENEFNPRARQNVIFELGYFAKSLGRKRVCALRKDNVEIPSDYQGVIYIPMDDGSGWKLDLTKELRAAGYAVDANDLL